LPIKKNHPLHYDYVEYEQYEKLQLSLSKVSDKIKSSKLLKNYQFLFQNVDTTKIEGKTLIPIYLEEKLSDIYYRKNPPKTKQIVKGDKKVNLGEFIDSNGVSSYLKFLYGTVDIYDNDIVLFNNQFLSPISDLAPTFYYFFIRDTTTDTDGKQMVSLYFTPRNTNDLLFRGIMYITLDGNYGVRKLNMYISKNANLNYVRELHVNEEFMRNEEDGRYYVVKSDMLSEASITKAKNGGIFGERMISFKNYKINNRRDDAFYKGLPEKIQADSRVQADSFWYNHRHEQLDSAEARAYYNADSLQNMPSFKRAMKIANFLLSGYVTF